MLNAMHLSSLSMHARIMHPWLPSRPSTCHFSHHLSSFDSSTTSRILPEHPSNPSSTCWCRGFESHISPPSRRRPWSRHPFPSPLCRCWWRPRLKELPRWRGMPWVVMKFVLITGLGLPMMDIGLEKKLGLDMLMEGNILLSERAVLKRWVPWAWVGAPSPSLGSS